MNALWLRKNLWQFSAYEWALGTFLTPNNFFPFNMCRVAKKIFYQDRNHRCLQMKTLGSNGASSQREVLTGCQRKWCRAWQRYTATWVVQVIMVCCSQAIISLQLHTLQTSRHHQFFQCQSRLQVMKFWQMMHLLTCTKHKGSSLGLMLVRINMRVRFDGCLSARNSLSVLHMPLATLG